MRMIKDNGGQAVVSHVVLIAVTMIVFVSLLSSVGYIGSAANRVASEAQFSRISGYVSSEVVRVYNLLLSSNSPSSMILVSLSLPHTVCDHNYGITVEVVEGKPQVVVYAEDNTNIKGSSPVCNIDAEFNGTIYSTASNPDVKISQSSNQVINIWLGNSL